MSTDKDIMPVSEFLEHCRSYMITNSDGFGYFMKTRKGKKVKTSIQAVPSVVIRGKMPVWATHIVWYCK